MAITTERQDATAGRVGVGLSKREAPLAASNAAGTLSHPKYRPDIDGLRAVAVLAVVGFHASPLWVSGGFVGVDIFFVISGYLISTIIFENLDHGRFSFRTFYARRIRRIFPALLIVLASTLLLGWLFLVGAEYWQLAKHAAAGATFAANYVFWHESGYFDDAAVTKPLLHLWSLGIEEQFYIFWPMLAWLAWKKRLNFIWLTAAVGCVSLAINLVEYRTDGAAAFYSIQTRAWELSLGSLLAALAMNDSKFVVTGSNRWSVIGFALIVISILSFSKDMPYPGWAALLPTLGAALVIAAGPEAVLNRLVLSNKASVWVGLISYPLYLWHWPLLSFAWIIDARDPPRGIRFGIVFVSVVLAWLTYRFVEKPVRRRPSIHLVPGLTSAMALIGAISFVAYVGQPVWLPNKYNRAVVENGDVGSPAFLAYYNEHFFRCATGSSDLDSSTDRCIRSRTDRPVDLAIVGDSHAQHLFPGLAEALPNANVAYLGVIESLGRSSKLPSIQNSEYATIFNYIQRQPSIKSVIISSYWYGRLHHDEIKKGDSLANELGIMAAALTAQGKKVFLAGDVPFFDLTVAGCKYVRVLGPSNSCEQDSSYFYREYQNWFPDLLMVSKTNKNVEVLNFAPTFCWDRFCHMVKNNVLLYRESTHLNIDGSKLLGHIIAKEHPRILEWSNDQ